MDPSIRNRYNNDILAEAMRRYDIDPDDGFASLLPAGDPAPGRYGELVRRAAALPGDKAHYGLVTSTLTTAISSWTATG